MTQEQIEELRLHLGEKGRCTHLFKIYEGFETLRYCGYECMCLKSLTYPIEDIPLLIGVFDEEDRDGVLHISSTILCKDVFNRILEWRMRNRV